MNTHPMIVIPYEGDFGDGYAIASNENRRVFTRTSFRVTPPVIPSASGAAVLFDDAEIGDLEFDAFIDSVASIDSEVSKALLEQHVEYLDALALTYDMRAHATHVRVRGRNLMITRYEPHEGRIQGTKRSGMVAGTINDSVARVLDQALGRYDVDARTWIATGSGLTVLNQRARLT